MLINFNKEGQKKYKKPIHCSMLIHFNEEGQKKQYKQLLKTGKQYKTVTCN